MKRKFIQIATTGQGSDVTLFALDDEGQVWYHAEKDSRWMEVKDVEKEIK